MAESFDPYYKWLAIPPAEQPANHYRLLGLALFEADSDTISIAADRQMTHVRTFQTGPHSALSQKLLNELAAARLCLLDRERKARYDADLRAQLGMTEPVASPALVTDVASRVRREQTRPRWIVPAVAAGGAFALALCVWGAVQLNRPAAPVAEQRPQPKRPQPVPRTPSTAAPATTDKNPVLNRGSVPPLNEKALTIPDAPPTTPGVTADRIVLWNTHNDTDKNRGTRECRLLLLKDGSELWRQENIEIPWSAEEDKNLSIPIPQLRFDRVRVEVVKFEGGGGGLAEIEVFQGDKNLARGCPAVASCILDPRFLASKVTDGITTSFYNGFWLAHDMAGWVEVDLAYAEPRPCEGVLADKLVVWNSHNSLHNDRGALEISVKLLSGEREVWQDENVQMPWQPDEDRRLDIPLPADVRFDRVRIDVNRFQGLGGSLAEVQVFQGEKNLAEACPVQGNGCLNHYYRSASVTDGITSSLQADHGYWCSYNDTGGWLEIDLSCNCPEIGKQNEALGLYRALAERDWSRGLPWLARAADGELRRLALLDESQLLDPGVLAMVGDGWWTFASASAGKARDALLGRAVFSYGKAIPRLAEIDRERLRQRIREALPLEGGAYLCCLEPTLVEQLFPDNNLYALPVVVDAVRYPFGLWTHPVIENFPVKVAYKLDEKYGGFYGGVANNDSSRGKNLSSLTFKILGDGRLLWTSQPIKAIRVSEPFDLDVTGVSVLELQVEKSADNAFCHAVWLDPRLDLSPPSADRSRGILLRGEPVPLAADQAESKAMPANNGAPAANPHGDAAPKQVVGNPAVKVKAPIPGDEALRDVARTLRQRFKSEWSGGKEPAAKLLAARALAEVGRKPIEQPAERYVLWEQVRSLASSAGDLDLACEAIGEICRQFERDAVGLKQESFAAAAKGVNSPEAVGYLLDSAAQFILEAVSADNLDTAKKIASTAQTIARKTKDPALIKTWAARGRELGELTKEYDQARAENFVSGKYEATAKGDWANGLPKMAKSSDTTWRSLAEAELAHAPPTDPKSLAEVMRVADGWWEVAEKAPWLQRYQLHRHATALYKEALPVAGGEERNKIEQRFLQLLAQDDGLPKWDLFEPGRIELHDTFARINANQSVATLALYRGPIDATIVARSDSTNIRLHAFAANGNFPGVIWNWELNPRELRVHHVDATLGTAPVTPLEAGRWYALRWVVTDRDVSVFVDGKPVFHELHANQNFPPSPLSLGGAYGSIVDVRKIIVKPLQ